jgi:uncharacterized protein (UPF0261 family)
MSEETARLTLRQADQLRTDIANVESSLEMIMAQLARLPTRKEQALRPLYIMVGSAGLVILWIEVFRRLPLVAPRILASNPASGNLIWLRLDFTRWNLIRSQ